MLITICYIDFFLTSTIVQKKIYVDFLKTYKNRFLKFFNFDIKIHLKQHNFNKQNKNKYFNFFRFYN